MPLLKQQNDEDKLNPANDRHSDDSHNPSLKHIHDREQQAAADRDEVESMMSPENYAKTGHNPRDPYGNAADDVKDRENTFGYEPNTDSERPRGPRKLTIKGMAAGALKGKKGPLAALVAILLGGGVLFSTMSLPALITMHFKETLSGIKLNDQLGAVNMRTPIILSDKINNSKAAFGVCTTKVSIHCKFGYSSKKQIQRYKDAGFNVKVATPPGFGGREKITELQFPDNGPTANDPSDLKRILRNDPNSTRLQAQLYKAYYPKSASLNNKFDKAVAKVFYKYGISKAPIFVGTNKADFDKQLHDSTRGDKTRSKLLVGDLDPEADEATRQKAADAQKELEIDQAMSLDEAKRKFRKGVGVLAAAQTGCGIYSLTNYLEGASKTIRAMQLVQFSQNLVLNPADQIKASESNPQISEYVNNKLTEPDMRKTIPDPEADPESGKTIENPAYGKTALDSPIYKAVAYDDAPVLPYRSAQFMVGGGLVGELVTVKNMVITQLAGEAGEESLEDFCDVVLSPVGIAISIAGMFTGVGLVPAIAGGVAGLVFEQLFMPIILQQIANTLAGEVVGNKTANVDIGDAATTGAAHMLGTVAQNRGLVPMSSTQFNNYLNYTSGANQQMIAAETEAAKETPFDMTNQYSFMGMFGRAVAPSFVSARTSAVGALQIVPSFLSTSLSSISASANANTSINPQRFERCADTAFEKIGMQADIGCFPRYGLPQDEIEMDITPVVQYMIDNGHIKEDDLAGEPVEGSDYAKWVAGCTAERTQGWGVDMENGDLSDELNTGEACLLTSSSSQANASGTKVTLASHDSATKDTVQLAQASGEVDKNKMFRVFHFNNSLVDGMEYEEVPKNYGGTGDAGDTTGNLENSGNIRDDGWAWPGPAGTNACGFDCYGGHFGMDILNAPDRSDIYAARDGEVIFAGVDPYMDATACRNATGGNAPFNGPQQTMVITHTVNGQKVDTLYTHITAGSMKVKVGDKVKAGDLIALSGSTGCSTGPHLHFGIYQGGWPSPSNAVDPTTILGRSG